MARLRWLLRIYARCLGAHVRSSLEYEHDFWIMSVAAVLTQGVGVIFLWAIFSTIPAINGWQFWEVVLIYSLVVIAEGVSVLLAQGVWSLAPTVNFGELDAVLVRPYPPVLQVLSAEVGMNGLGNVGLGFALLVGSVAHVDVRWTASRIVLGIILLVSACAVKIGLNLATNAVAFWIRSPWSMVPFSLHTLGELTRYPLTIYSLGVRLALSVVLPYAFMSFFPATAILGRGPVPWLGYLTPVLAIYCLALGIGVFNLGLRRYESTGQ